VLGFCIGVVAGGFILFLLYEWLHPEPLEIKNWPLTVGVFTAVIGWMVSAWVTLRNSIKQHTFNIWLQTRCSAKYMEHAEQINSAYFARNAGDSQLDMTTADVTLKQSALYVLNHSEFIAVGIRTGDLDEMMVKQTMRGMMCGLYEFFRDYIEQEQQKNPSTYEHLTALYHRWKK